MLFLRAISTLRLVFLLLDSSADGVWWMGSVVETTDFTFIALESLTGKVNSCDPF